MSATVNEVHHWNRQDFCVCATQVTVKWQTQLGCGGSSVRQRDRQNRVATKFGFVVCAIQCQHRVIHRVLVGGVQTDHFVGDQVFNVFDGLKHAFATVTFAAIT